MIDPTYFEIYPELLSGTTWYQIYPEQLEKLDTRYDSVAPLQASSRSKQMQIQASRFSQIQAAEAQRMIEGAICEKQLKE